MNIHTRRDFTRYIIAAVTGSTAVPALASVPRPKFKHTDTESKWYAQWQPEDPKRSFMYPAALRALCDGEISIDHDDFNLALVTMHHVPGELFSEDLRGIVEQAPVALHLDNLTTVRMPDVTFPVVSSDKLILRLVLYRSSPAPHWLVSSLTLMGLPFMSNGSKLICHLNRNHRLYSSDLPFGLGSARRTLL